MPLHLLGKKSWNVYNTVNIEKVKRDEAAAAAKEAAEEQRMQEEDAEDRTRQLRGLSPIERISTAPAEDDKTQDHKDRERHGHERKRRRLHGEDDTDRDIRYAKETRALERDESSALRIPPKSSDAPIVDRDGHTALFAPDSKAVSKSAAGKDGPAKEPSDQRAARPKKDDSLRAAVGEAPWYSAGNVGASGPIVTVSKDAWGNEDPRRKDRDMARLASSDPLMAMQRGVQGVRKVEKEKRKWREERKREISDLISEGRRSEKKRKHSEHRTRHRRRTEEGEKRSRDRARGEEAWEHDSLEGFRLDAKSDAAKPQQLSVNGRRANPH